MFEGHSIAFCPDGSHALKGLKNYLFNYGEIQLSEEEVRDFDLVSNLVQLIAIQDLVEFQENLEYKPAPRLTKAVLAKAVQRYGKMDVGTTMAIFNRDTSNGILHMISKGGYPNSYTTTAHCIERVAYWYQIMGERGMGFAFSNMYPEQRDSQIDFLNKFSYYTSKMILSKKQRDAIADKNNPSLEAVQKSVLMSAKSIIWLQEKMLADPEVKYYAAGRALGDSIEAHNGHLRFYQKNPSPTQVKRFSKIISVSHFLTRVMGSNVPPDESVFLTEFESLKILKIDDDVPEDESEDTSELEHFTEIGIDLENFQSFEDYSEANSLSYINAFVLHKTILKKGSKCDLCKKVLVAQNSEGNDQIVNTLIQEKEWKERLGYLTRPSKLANEMFHTAEALFKANRDNYYKQKNIKEKMVDFICQQLNEKFEIHSSSCLKFIMTRFIKCLLFFWANHMNKSDIKLLAKAKVENAYASKSTMSIKATQLK